MAFTLEDLLSGDQQLRTVQPHQPIGDAINIMHHHGYGQLPVTSATGEFLNQVVTFESILRAMQCFRTEASSLLVRDAVQRARIYRPDADLLTTLDDIHRENFALIVDDSSRLTGIVTTADIAVFFREYAQDLMQIEGIESRVKDAIRGLYAGDGYGLEAAIGAVTDRAAEIRKKLPGAIKAYCGKAGLGIPPLGSDTDALSEAEKRLGLSEPTKKFEDLSFDEFIGVLFLHPSAPKLAQSKSVSELRLLLQQVRDARNKLAHFRGELTSEQRRIVQFAEEWLERNLPAAPSEPPPPLAVATLKRGHQEEEGEAGPHGSYWPLAAHLEAQPASITSVSLSFQQIEAVLGKELPRSAYEYRAWWSNDPMKPQSAAWLEEGWRTTSVSMTDRRLIFVRTNDREDAYIAFFAKLNARLAQETNFPLRNVSPQGQSWLVLASMDKSGPEAAAIFAAFTRRKQLRIELYLDGGTRDANKQRFDRLQLHKGEIERAAGEPLQWERMDNRKACRVAVYTKAQLLAGADSEILLEWASKRAVSLFRAFEPEFSSSAEECEPGVEPPSESKR